MNGLLRSVCKGTTSQRICKFQARIFHRTLTGKSQKTLPANNGNDLLTLQNVFKIEHEIVHRITTNTRPHKAVYAPHHNIFSHE